MINKPYTIGVIGHRDIGSFDNHEYAHLVIHEILSCLKQEYCDVRAILALSVGANSLFAKSAISLNIQLDSVRPFENYSDDFKSEESRVIYFSMKDSTIQLRRPVSENFI